ncbi:MAG: hypothetical protein QM626_10235, partial [Microbacterium sp.]|uniref:hypothetical protein n=1 Tax=Microbacterium sp. TaxID=51671 RepID=UPI0039E4DF81
VDVAPAGAPVAACARDTLTVALPAAAVGAERTDVLQRRFDELTPLVAYEDLPRIGIAQEQVSDIATLDALIPPRRTRRGRIGLPARL